MYQEAKMTYLSFTNLPIKVIQFLNDGVLYTDLMSIVYKYLLTMSMLCIVTMQRVYNRHINVIHTSIAFLC